MLSVLVRGGTSGSSPTPVDELSGVHMSVSSPTSRLVSYGGKKHYKALVEVVTVIY